MILDRRSCNIFLVSTFCLSVCLFVCICYYALCVCALVCFCVCVHVYVVCVFVCMCATALNILRPTVIPPRTYCHTS